MREYLLLVVERSYGEGVNGVACFIDGFSCIYSDLDDVFTLESLHLARPSKGGG